METQKWVKRVDPVPVYFIRAGETGPIKIGVSEGPKGRLSALQTAHYEQLHIVGWIPGGYAKEAELHARFKHINIRGEWFQPTKELLDAIKAMLVEAHPVKPGHKDWRLVEID